MMHTQLFLILAVAVAKQDGFESWWSHAQKKWLSGRVLDSRLRDCGLEPHWHHCVVSLSKTRLSFLSTGATQEDPSRHN